MAVVSLFIFASLPKQHPKKTACLYQSVTSPQKYSEHYAFALANLIAFFFPGCCLGRSRAVCPSVSEAKGKETLRPSYHDCNANSAKTCKGASPKPQANKGETTKEKRSITFDIGAKNKCSHTASQPGDLGVGCFVCGE